MKYIFSLYTKLFAHTRFKKLNYLLFQLSIRGMGVLNYKNMQASGESWLLKRLMEKEALNCIIDVGAHQGVFTLEVLKNNPNTTVIAFEPHPITFKKLRHNLKDYKNVMCCNLALGIDNNELVIYDYAENLSGSSHASLYRDVITDIHNSKLALTEIKVPVRKLDDLIGKYELDRVVDLLKIDTEGHEKAVIEGFVETINNNEVSYILFEFNEMNSVSRVFLKDFLNLLPDYDFFRLLPKGLLPIKPYSPLFHELFAFQNILAIKEGKEVL